MPELTKPYVLVPDRALSKVELTAAIRLALMAENDAVSLYTLQAEATDDPLVKKVLLKIADEERVHFGELLTLLEYLTEDESEFLKKGEKEVGDMGGEVIKGVVTKNDKED
jgi:uncharacterized protein